MYSNKVTLDWHGQISNSIRSIDDLRAVLDLSPELDRWFKDNFAFTSLPFSVTPYFASLMDGSVNCPILAQVVSSAQELKNIDHELLDPLGEEPRQKVKHLVHRYPDRVLFLATDRCASYCRFCTRKRWVGQGPSPQKDQQEEAFAYIESKPEIREIIFSGGDPLVLSNRRLEDLMERAFSIKHVDVVRFHTRMLSFAPMRIDKEFLTMVGKYTPVYLVSHFNHPRELTDMAIKALKDLHSSGVTLLNQSVLLKGVNDDVDVLRELFLKLVKNHNRPYYLHQCDLVKGGGHFRVPIKRSLEIIESLRGRISGLCLPTLVIDIPHGYGKVPLVANAIDHEDEDFIYLRGFKGGVSAYPKY